MPHYLSMADVKVARNLPAGASPQNGRGAERNDVMSSPEDVPIIKIQFIRRPQPSLTAAEKPSEN
jgi:hypothetical protein